MKNLILPITVIFSAVLLLVGCGGGDSTSSASSTNTTPIVTTQAFDLVINNGRGTSNNQETEAPSN